MAQLDPFIAALFEHSAESLILKDGGKISLTVSGALRPVVKTAVNGPQIRRLIGEIAPPSHREAVATRRNASRLRWPPPTSAR